MRVLSVLLVTVALAAASGCFGKDDTPDTTPPPTTPTGATPTTPTGSTPTDPTPTTPTMPMAPPPKDLCTVSKDFSSQQPTPPATDVVTTGDCGMVTEGYTKIVLAGNWTSSAPIPLQSSVSVQLVDAAGTAVATCTAPAPPAQLPAECTPIESMAAVGAYTLAFHGSGIVSFAGVVSVS